MREIKFRFYRTKKKEMVYGFEHCSLTYVLGMWENEKHVSAPMQYTGLKDKNGHDLYEHDMTKDKYSNISVCCWIKEVAAFAFVPVEIYPKKDWNTLFEEQGEDTFFRNDKPAIYHEVIGNIYENPELLEGETIA